MRKPLKAFATTAALIAGLATASVLYAEESGSSHESPGSMMGPGMMGGDNMKNMMGMMHMMEQMPQMSQMMDHCSQMMNGGMGDGSGKPNEQWRKDAPTSPDDNN